MKKRVTVYHCTGRTDAIDRSNLYYIASPTATNIQTEPDKITVTGKKGNPLAVFLFAQ